MNEIIIEISSGVIIDVKSKNEIKYTVIDYDNLMASGNNFEVESCLEPVFSTTGIDLKECIDNVKKLYMR